MSTIERNTDCRLKTNLQSSMRPLGRERLRRVAPRFFSDWRMFPAAVDAEVLFRGLANEHFEAGREALRDGANGVMGVLVVLGIDHVDGPQVVFACKCRRAANDDRYVVR